MVITYRDTNYVEIIGIVDRKIRMNWMQLCQGFWNLFLAVSFYEAALPTATFAHRNYFDSDRFLGVLPRLLLRLTLRLTLRFTFASRCHDSCLSLVSKVLSCLVLCLSLFCLILLASLVLSFLFLPFLFLALPCLCLAFLALASIHKISRVPVTGVYPTALLHTPNPEICEKCCVLTMFYHTLVILLSSTCVT